MSAAGRGVLIRSVLPARNLLFNYSDHVVGVCDVAASLKLQIAEAQGSRRRVLVVPASKMRTGPALRQEVRKSAFITRGFRAPFVISKLSQRAGHMDRHYERPLPETITTILDDGCIAISVGDFTGIVSSMHLIEPKAHQLQSAWLARESELSDAR